MLTLRPIPARCASGALIIYIADLPLSSLDLSHCVGVTDHGVLSLTKFRCSLVRLDLTNTGVTDAGVAAVSGKPRHVVRLSVLCAGWDGSTWRCRCPVVRAGWDGSTRRCRCPVVLTFSSGNWRGVVCKTWASCAS